MCTLLTFVAFLVFCLVWHCGNAMFECPVPPNSSLIYFDLKRLNSLALQQGYHNSVHSPLLCLKGKDEECSEQKCCPDEVGCCLSNRMDKRHVRECGCKEFNSAQCTFPAPYAIPATDKCTATEKTKITACLREKREDEYLNKQTALNTKSKAYIHEDGTYKGVDGLMDDIKSFFRTEKVHNFWGPYLNTSKKIDEEIPRKKI